MATQVMAGETNEYSRRVYFQLVDVNDFQTPVLGEEGQPQISINGAAWADDGVGELVEIGNGRYYALLAESSVSVSNRVIETRYKSELTAEIVGTTIQVVGYSPNSGAIASI